MSVTRMEFATQRKAQDFADAVHQRMIGAEARYAANVAAGVTTAWAKPYQDTDENGDPIGTKWYVNLRSERTDKVLSGQEKTDAKPHPRQR